MKSDDEIQLLKLHEKLTSKTETILRLGKDLEEAEKEKFRLSSLCKTFERNLARAEKDVERLLESEKCLRSSHSKELEAHKTEMEQLRRQVFEMTLENKELRAEKGDLQKDCKLFRQQIAKYEVEKMDDEAGSAARVTARPSNAEVDLSENLLGKYKQMESDFVTVLGVKEELVKERDNLLRKVDRLSAEISYMLNGDNRRVTEDLDTLLAENRFLKAQLNTAQEESESIKATLAKYRSMAESLPQNVKGETKQFDHEKGSVAVVNMKHIRELLASQAIELDDSDLRAITTILLDVCDDRHMALTHLRRANKVLGTRLHEVEGRLAVLEGKQSRSTSPRVPNLQQLQVTEDASTSGN